MNELLATKHTHQDAFLRTFPDASRDLHNILDICPEDLGLKICSGGTCCACRKKYWGANAEDGFMEMIEPVKNSAMKTSELERELLVTYEGLMAQKAVLEKNVKHLASKPSGAFWSKTAKSFAEYEQVCGAIRLVEQVLHIKPVNVTEEADESQSC